MTALRQTFEKTNFPKELENIKRIFKFKQPEVHLKNDDLCLLFNLAKNFDVDFMGHEVYVIPAENRNTIVMGVEFYRRSFRKTVGDYSLDFQFSITQNGTTILSDCIGSVDIVDGCKAILEYYDKNGNKHKITNFILKKDFFKRTK
jgi:hypothetical protein